MASPTKPHAFTQCACGNTIRIQLFTTERVGNLIVYKPACVDCYKKKGKG